VHLITRRTSSFFVPLVDRVTRNIEQYRNLIGRDPTLIKLVRRGSCSDLGDDVENVVG
jgi:hypothetical protein